MAYAAATLERLRDRLFAGSVEVTYARGAQSWNLSALRGPNRWEDEQTSAGMRRMRVATWIIRAADLAAVNIKPAAGDVLTDDDGKHWELIEHAGTPCAVPDDRSETILRLQTIARPNP